MLNIYLKIIFILYHFYKTIIFKLIWLDGIKLKIRKIIGASSIININISHHSFNIVLKKAILNKSIYEVKKIN